MQDSDVPVVEKLVFLPLPLTLQKNYPRSIKLSNEDKRACHTKKALCRTHMWLSGDATLKISAQTTSQVVCKRCNFAPDSHMLQSPCTTPRPHHGIDPTTEYSLSTNRKRRHWKGPSEPSNSVTNLMRLFRV